MALKPSRKPGTRLRALLNVRVRLSLLFLLLLIGLAGMAQVFYQHVQDSQTAERQFQEAQTQLRLYTRTHESILQFRIVLLRVGLLASVAPQQINENMMEEVAASQRTMEQRLNDLATVDAPESAALKIPVNDVPTLIQTVRELAAARRYIELRELLAPLMQNFGQLNTRILASMERTHARSEAATRLASNLHQTGLDTSIYLIAATLITALLLTYLTLRNVLLSLDKIMAALHSIPAKHSGQSVAPATKVSGDEFDQMSDALEQLRASTLELNQRAYVHPLTGLPNNVKLTLELERELQQARELNLAVALLFVDLNDFRSINDAIGHDTGDACLCELAERLRALTAPRETVFHFSGDLFALYLQAPVEEIRMLASTLAARVHATILQPVAAADRSLRLTASISVALFPEHADDVSSLISAADAAVHQAKRQGRDNTQWANRDLAAHADTNLKLTADIQRGLKASEFVPYYEPIIDIENNCVAGAEALLRWRHPQKGVLRPADFLDVADQTGQLYPMTSSAFRQACTQFAQWPNAPYLTFNLSPRQIRPALASVVRRVLQDTGMPAERLEFEITENALMDRVEQVAQILTELRDIGVRLSLDDFGTGYSSLNYLQRLPVNKLKIDRCFVSRLDSSRASQAIINAILSIARNLHLEVVAEGVETQNQLDILRAMGCRYLQGYLFTPALPAAEFAEWIKLSPLDHLARKAASE